MPLHQARSVVNMYEVTCTELVTAKTPGRTRRETSHLQSVGCALEDLVAARRVIKLSRVGMRSRDESRQS